MQHEQACSHAFQPFGDPTHLHLRSPACECWSLNGLMRTGLAPSRRIARPPVIRYPEPFPNPEGFFFDVHGWTNVAGGRMPGATDVQGCQCRGRMDALERRTHRGSAHCAERRSHGWRRPDFGCGAGRVADKVQMSREAGCRERLTCRAANVASAWPKIAPGWKPLLRFQHSAIHGEHIFGITPSMAGRCAGATGADRRIS